MYTNEIWRISVMWEAQANKELDYKDYFTFDYFYLDYSIKRAHRSDAIFAFNLFHVSILIPFPS